MKKEYTLTSNEIYVDPNAPTLAYQGLFIEENSINKQETIKKIKSLPMNQPTKKTVYEQIDQFFIRSAMVVLWIVGMCAAAALIKFLFTDTFLK